jgi:CBS domain-containing protein
MLTATDVMTRNVVTALPTDRISKLATLLSVRGVSAMPVCDAGGHIVGMVSEGDLLRPFGEEHALKRAWWLELLAEGVDLAPAFVDYIRPDKLCADDVMTRSVVSAGGDATVAELADLLSRHKIKRVPIVANGRLVGIVSRADLVRAIASTPALMAEPV